ncbi:MAG: putative sulfate exporter family transporter, partial [Burkholderiales bacterium]|nr:putative sulfate exporter family transporter [Burkholderiales bacterium]
VASVLPPTKANERFTLLTVMGITLLSTTAMVLYPLLARWTGLTPLQAGVFFGASIHDVAQVVAAGTLLSHAGEVAAADSAVIVKLFRVMLLMPVVLTVALVVSRRQARDKTNTDTDTDVHTEAGPAVPLIPGFLLVFIVFMLANSSGWVPPAVTTEGSQWSRHLLVVAIAAVGIKTQPADLLKLGWAPVAMLLAETIWIAGLALAAVHWI